MLMYISTQNTPTSRKVKHNLSKTYEHHNIMGLIYLLHISICLKYTKRYYTQCDCTTFHQCLYLVLDVCMYTLSSSNVARVICVLYFVHMATLNVGQRLLYFVCVSVYLC